MTTQAPSKFYHYNTHGHGFSAHFHRPMEHLIDVQAPSSLPTTGGHGTSRVNNFKFQELVSFGSAYSHVSGSSDPLTGHHTSLATATVEGLNIQDVVTADRIVARMATRHPAGEGEPHFELAGSRFENLQITGCRVEVEFDHAFFQRLDTFQALLKELETNAEFRKMAEDPFKTGKAQKLPDVQGVLLCSLVKEMKTTCPGVKQHGHCFLVPQFGRIYLAEVLARHATRTLTMLKVEMGCAVSGVATAAEVVGNGRPWP
jgi:hypothetical protein